MRPVIQEGFTQATPRAGVHDATAARHAFKRQRPGALVKVRVRDGAPHLILALDRRCAQALEAALIFSNKHDATDGEVAIMLRHVLTHALERWA